MHPCRAIVIGLGSAGDVHPCVGLALALRQRGHAVTVVAPSVFQPLVRQAGLDFVGLLTESEWQAALNDPNLWHPLRSFSAVARRLILPVLRPIYEIIAGNFEPGRTVVAASGLAFGARIAQEKLGVPLATLHLQPVMLRSVVQPACLGFPDIVGHLPVSLRRLYFRAADRWVVDRLLAGPVNAFRAELGLPPVKLLFENWMHSPELVVGLFPSWFAPPAPDWPPHVALTGFPLWDGRETQTALPELEEFLAQGTPPLVFTAGSANAQAKRFFQVSVEACRAGNRRGILLTYFPEQLPGVLPDGVRHFDYVPFSMLLPRSAALIHHGGIGTAAQAIAAGIPQLIVPMSHDQPDNALRIRRFGVGDFLLPRNYTPSGVLEKLRCLESPAVKTCCQHWAMQMAGNRSLVIAAELIEGLAGPDPAS
jgi:UDP:flavonoid glycosyltransferase YjiC (YdhE family)